MSAGEYSSYEVTALGRVKEDCETNSLQDEYLKLNPRQNGEYKLNEKQYLAWLTRDGGVIEEIPYLEYHYADYSTFSSRG